MSAEIIPFDFEDQAVRVVMRDGAPWWVVADVCRVLEIGNPRDAISRLDDDEKDGVGITDAIGRNQTVNAINESGLYALVLTSRKPAAKRFRKWITSEVLPSLRRHGRYDMSGAPSDMREISADRLIELLEAENTLLKSGIRSRKPHRARVPLTPEERARIAELAEKGLSLSEISRICGRSQGVISAIRSMTRQAKGAA